MTRGKITRIGLALCLAAVLTVGSTLAYLTWSNTDDPVVNMFTFSDGINAEVIEEKWDDHGKDDAKKMMPGSSADKDPAIKNNGDATNGIDIYVAVRLTFQSKIEPGPATLNQTQMTKLLDQIAFYYGLTSASGYNTAKWKARSTDYDADNPVQVWYYEDNSGLISLSPQETTETLFDKVKIKTDADIEFLSSTLCGFNIVVEGAAIQTSNITEAEAKDELFYLFFPGLRPAP